MSDASQRLHTFFVVKQPNQSDRIVVWDTQDITLGRYVALDSPIHRLDPRTKLVASLSLMIVALSAPGFAPLLSFTAFLLPVIALSRRAATAGWRFKMLSISSG